jgi:NAD(P)-dependent dehydrogenase (short-subunit alcohol dehydrogenase family)
MQNMTCLITGTASGMGRLTAFAAAKAGMRVICVDFDVPNGMQVKDEAIAMSGNDKIDFIECDVSSFAQVRELAARINRDYDQLDILVNNAGITEATRRESANGYEMTMATNFLGPFLLTNLLLNKLRKSPSARIINISSDSHKMIKGLDWDDIDNRKKWNGVNHGTGFQAYARSKICMCAFSFELAELLADDRINVYTVSPGYFIKTNIFRHMRGIMALGVKLVWPFLQSVESGAKTHIWLTTTAELDKPTGKYWEHCELKEPSALSQDNAVRKKVWGYAVDATGLTATETSP